MNKKGFTAPSLGNLIFIFILLLVLVVLMPIEYGVMDLDEGIQSLNNSQHTTYNQYINYDVSNQSDSTEIRILLDIIYKFISFIIYCTFEVAKLALIVGHNYLGVAGVKLLLYLVLFACLAPLIVPLFKLTIITCILIYDFIQHRKEKKQLKKLKEKNETRS